MASNLFIFICTNFFIIAYTLDPQPFIIPGKLNVALLLDIHSNDIAGKSECSEINPTAVEQLLAAIWTAQILAPDEASTQHFGYTVYDTCGLPEIATRQIYHLISNTQNHENCSLKNKTTLLGVIGIGENPVLSAVTSLLNAFSIPFVIASPGGQDLDRKAHNILVTSPGLTSQVKPLTSLLTTFQWKTVRIISSSSVALEEFISFTESTDIAITETLYIADGEIEIQEVRRILEKNEDEHIIIIALLSPLELYKLTNILSTLNTKGVYWVIASPAMDRMDLKQFGPILGEGIFVETHNSKSDKFQDYISDVLSKQNYYNLTVMQDIIKIYAMKKFKCSWNLHEPNRCQSLTNKALKSYHQHPAASHVAEAVSALASAYQIIRLDFCQENLECPDPEPLGPRIISAMRKLGYSFNKDLQPEYEGVQFRFTESGKLVNIHSHIIFYNRSDDPISIGWYSEEFGISLNSFPASFTRDHFQMNEYHQVLNHTVKSKPIIYSNEVTYNFQFGQRISHDMSVRRPWAAATLILAGLGILGTLYVLVYIVLRIYDGTLTGNRTIFVCLLLSVALLYCTCITFVFPPNEFMCTLRFILHPLAHTLCYSILLAQSMALKSVTLLGVGGSINYLHLLITSGAIIAVQLSILVEFILITNVWLNSSVCNMSSKVFVLLHIPCVIVLIITAICAFVCRKIQKNRQEMISVLLVSIICLPVWIGWSALIYSAPPVILEPGICAHLLTIATVILFGIFIPKLRKLSQHSSSFDHRTLSNAKPIATLFQLSNTNGNLQHPVNTHKFQISAEK